MLSNPISRLLLATALVAGLGLLTTLANGQARSQQGIMVVDDGQGPSVIHISTPDLHTVREPDFIRSDLPIFQEKLQLSEAQGEVYSQLIEQYLQSFRALVAEHLGDSDHEHGRDVAFGLGEGDDQWVGDGLGEGMEEVIEHLGHMSEEGNFEIEEGTGMIAITIEAGADGMNQDIEAGAGPVSGVVIEVSGMDDAEIPEELRKQLEEHAQELADRLADEMEAGGLHEGGAGLGAGAMERMEARQQEIDDLQEAVDRFTSARSDLRMRFVTDAQAVLAPEQLERWPKVEYTLTRVKTLPKGRLSGERTDLFKVVDTLDLSPGQLESIETELEQYEVALHDALQRRNQFVPEANSKVDQAIQEGNPDRALSVIDRATKLRLSVRRTNERYTQVLTEQLGPPADDALVNAVRKASYPRVYRPTRGQRAFEAVTRLELDAQIAEAVEDLSAVYTGELQRRNEQLRQTIRENEPDEPRRAIEQLKEIMSGDGPTMIGMPSAEDPIAKAFAARAELDETYMTRLRALLGEERVAAVPELSPRKQRKPMVIRRVNEPQ